MWVSLCKNYTQNIKTFLDTHEFDILICDPEGYKNSDKQSIQCLLREMKPHALIIGIITTGGWRERVEFLNHGGDEALAYPFPLQELLARIQVLLNRPKLIPNYTLKVCDMSLDTSDKKIVIGEKSINMRNKEFNILEYLVRNKNRVITRSELMDHVWDYRRISGSNTVDVHINNIRNKIGREKIKTVHGLGYRLEDGTKS